MYLARFGQAQISRWRIAFPVYSNWTCVLDKFFSSPAMAPKSHTQTHVPSGAREVKIIRRLNHVIRLPVPRIAKAIDRNKSTVYGAFDKKWRPLKRGRKEILSKVTKDWRTRETTRRQLQDN